MKMRLTIFTDPRLRVEEELERVINELRRGEGGFEQVFMNHFEYVRVGEERALGDLTFPTVVPKPADPDMVKDWPMGIPSYE